MKTQSDLIWPDSQIKLSHEVEFNRSVQIEILKLNSTQWVVWVLKFHKPITKHGSYNLSITSNDWHELWSIIKTIQRALQFSITYVKVRHCWSNRWLLTIYDTQHTHSYHFVESAFFDRRFQFLIYLFIRVMFFVMIVTHCAWIQTRFVSDVVS